MEWGILDYLVVDLPPGTGDVALSLIQTVPLTASIVVSTPSDVSLQDARKAIEMFRQMKVDIAGIVENMSYFVLSALPARNRHLLRGGAKICAPVRVDFLGSIQLDPEIDISGAVESQQCWKAKCHPMPKRCLTRQEGGGAGSADPVECS